MTSEYHFKTLFDKCTKNRESDKAASDKALLFSERESATLRDALAMSQREAETLREHCSVLSGLLLSRRHGVLEEIAHFKYPSPHYVRTIILLDVGE